jgi:glyoxylase-like metal-dependent hydrolase (beta-lactamase superfamily II)
MSLMVKPVVAKFETVTCPCYSFLIQHPSGRNLVFDLGIRKDFDNGAPNLVGRIKKAGWKVEVEKDIATILTENDMQTKDIEGIIWSHYHWDHTGDPSRFPSSTALIVGPGFKGRFPHAYPTDEKSVLTEDAWTGRELREVSFAHSEIKIGRFKAVDYFGDGSFYLLDTPGHLLGHICGLARTTADTYIFMGGDAAHHAGEIRPTEHLPLPREIKLDPTPVHFPHCCPGEILMNDVHPEKSATKPFYRAADGFNEDSEVADWTIEGVSDFDADEHVLVVIAHDRSMHDVVDFFPKPANEWKSKGWGTSGRWRFLADFSAGLEGARAAGKL